MKLLSVRMDEKKINQLKRGAKKFNVSVAEYLRRLVEHYATQDVTDIFTVKQSLHPNSSHFKHSKAQELALTSLIELRLLVREMASHVDESLPNKAQASAAELAHQYLYEDNNG